jgi:hypothetical protein
MWIEWDWMGLNLKQVKLLLNFSNPIQSMCIENNRTSPKLDEPSWVGWISSWPVILVSRMNYGPAAARPGRGRGRRDEKKDCRCSNPFIFGTWGPRPSKIILLSAAYVSCPNSSAVCTNAFTSFLIVPPSEINWWCIHVRWKRASNQNPTSALRHAQIVQLLQRGGSGGRGSLCHWDTKGRFIWPWLCIALPAGGRERGRSIKQTNRIIQSGAGKGAPS